MLGQHLNGVAHHLRPSSAPRSYTSKFDASSSLVAWQVSQYQ